jgi:hypothetical protein
LLDDSIHGRASAPFHQKQVARLKKFRQRVGCLCLSRHRSGMIKTGFK